MKKEIQEKNDAELTEFLAEKRESLRVSRFGTAGSQNRDVRFVRKTRRDVARILTLMNQRTAK